MKDNRMQFVWKTLIYSVFLVTFVGCAGYYNPTEMTYPINENMIPSFSGKGTITIKNLQPHGKEFVLVNQKGITLKGDLGKWTDTAVNYLKIELTKRNLIVTDTAQKKLKVSITNAKAIIGSFAYRCIVNLRLEAGDGYVREFEGNNMTPTTLHKAADGAVMKAVVAALNDSGIVAYLEK